MEDPANEPKYNEILELGVSPEQAPDVATYVTIHFEKGIPTAIDGVNMNALEVMAKLNQLGGSKRYWYCGYFREQIGWHEIPRCL